MKKQIISFVILCISSLTVAQINESSDLYNLNKGLKSRSISFENPTGEPGQGGKAASKIGIGRKGAPAKYIKPGEEVVLCDIKGTGTIRHIWMTGTWMNFSWSKDTTIRARLLRTTVIRAYWDGQEYPSIECPLGDFMGLAHAQVTSYQSVAHSVGENTALNIWLPMPFKKNARITLTNESNEGHMLYYQVDYTINDNHPEDVGRLHVCFRRENPTTIKRDFVLMPKREGKGKFLGAVVGIRTLHPDWWGEGEIKFYMDGDDEFPTICGTGSEDWVGLSYGIQETPFLYHGCNLNFVSDSTTLAYDYLTEKTVEMKTSYVSMYRWHILDPVYWDKECRVTIQQIGCCPYYDREDDWSTATFWYEAVPSKPLPEFPSLEERTKDIEELLNQTR